MLKKNDNKKGKSKNSSYFAGKIPINKLLTNLIAIFTGAEVRKNKLTLQRKICA